MRDAIYEERQGYAPWAYAIVGVVLAIMGVIFLKDAGGSSRPFVWEIVGGQILICVLVFNILYLRIRVKDDGIHVSLGYLFPVFWRNLSFAKIKEVRAITYRPLLDAGGYGLRYGRFEGRVCQYWNARGNQGVLIDLAGRRVILGSRQPQALAEAVRQAMDKRA